MNRMKPQNSNRTGNTPGGGFAQKLLKEIKKLFGGSEEDKKQNYLHGAAILTVGVLAMKVLGAIYKVPLGNILGDEGYSMFIGAYNIYNIFFTLATAGLPVALSRMIAEANANGRAKQEEKIFRTALMTFTVIGILFALTMYLNANWWAGSYLENPDAADSIRAMAPAILLVCMVSAYRGYCQGNGNMIPTTVDEVLEVLFKVIAGLILAKLLLKRGLGLTMGAAGAIMGVSVGSVVSLAYMIYYRRKNYAELAAPYTNGLRAVNDVPWDDDVVDPTSVIIKRILKIGIPIALGSCVLAILNSVDSKLCMNRLQTAAGFSYREAKILYGVYGKAQTLFNLPAAFAQPLTISIVPAIAGAMARGNKDEAANMTGDSLRISSVIALPMGIGLAVLSEPIMNVLYPNSHEAGPMLLTVMGIAAFFVCLVLMENAILAASGHERFVLYVMIAGGVIKIVVNWFLVAKPGINIYGAPVGTLVSYVAMFAMDLAVMSRRLDRAPDLLKAFGGPLAASVLMGAAALAVYKVFSAVLGTGRLAALIAMLLAMAVAVVVYFVAVIRARVITAADMAMIPKGDKVARLLHMR